MINNIINSAHLAEVFEFNLSDPRTYYLIVNQWDKVPINFTEALKDSETLVNVIDIFDIPNPLEIMRELIKESKETMNVSSLMAYDQLPIMVVMHKAFPRVVTYNGSIAAELGI